MIATGRKTSKPAKKVALQTFPHVDFRLLSAYLFRHASRPPYRLQNRVVDEPGLADPNRQGQQRRIMDLFDFFQCNRIAEANIFQLASGSFAISRFDGLR